jgi:deoxyadenosine/deoxycytidine kinase
MVNGMRGGITRIEICGGIASGKTTLAKLLQGADLISIFEDFRKNPFYRAFYCDPAETAFETELTFLLQHYHQEKDAARHMKSFCADFSMVLDDAYACVTLTSEKLRLFRSVQKHIETELPSRALLVHLQCPPEVELKRIRRRRRLAERTITLAYLSKINGALDTRAESLSRSERVLVIDSDVLDFAHYPDAQADVRRRITGALANA